VEEARTIDLWRAERAALYRETAPDNLNLLLDGAAERHGEKTAFDFFESGALLTFADWRGQACRLAGALRARGVRQGARVGVMLINRPQFPIAWMAIARLGAVMVPINPAYTTRELRHIVDVADVSFLIVEGAALAQVRALEAFAREKVVAVGLDRPPPGIEAWDRLIDEAVPVEGPEQPLGRRDLAVIQFTSGTTGLPKGCMQSHDYWTIAGFNCPMPAAVMDSGSILADSPFFYFDGLWMIMRTLTHGKTAHTARRKSISKQFDRLIETQAETAFAPVLGEQPDPRERQTNVRFFITAGASAATTEAVEARCGVACREAFGMTEIGVALSVPLESRDPAIRGSCGYPMPLYELMVVDETGSEQPAGEAGELWVRGPGIFLGYCDNPEANARAFAGEWFRTGDIFVKAKAGYFSYLGRTKDMIKRSGENVSAVEVERVIAAYPGVAAAAVVPQPDALRGEEVKAFLQLKEPAAQADFDHAAFRTYCAGQLARFKLPRFLSFVAGFDYTPSGKIAKSALTAPERQKEPCWDYERAS